MSIAYDLECCAERIRESIADLHSSTTADYMDLEGLREVADELDEIAAKLRH